MADNIGLRLKEKRKEKGLSVQALGVLLDIPPDRIYKWEKGTKPSDIEDYKKIDAFLHDNLETFPINSKVDVSNLESFTERRRKQKVKENPYLVPFMPVKAQAGYVRAIDQEVFIDTLERYALPPGVNPQGAVWRYWEVEGDSMEPAFHSGDIILTSQVHQLDWENLRNFYLYVIVTQDRVLFKRLYAKNELEWVLISENEELYPQQLLPVEYIKEVWVYRRSIVNKAPPTKMFEIKV
jgi:phage repressor protein C with HTH and peptisase S24 domain